MSDKSIVQKLLIKEGHRVALVHAPKGYRSRLGALPRDVEIATTPGQDTDLVQVFVANRKELEAQLPKLRSALSPKAILWVTYLKGTSKMKTDINRDSIHAYAKTLGLLGVSMISIDDDWSAMRFKVV